MIVWLEVRHFKAYKWKKFIPIWNEHNFVSYTWENWVWKSSILESLDTFLNNKDWLLTKKEKNSDSYICPIFLIPKYKVTRLTTHFEAISDHFWWIDKKDKNNKFFEIRDKLSLEYKSTHFIIFIGEDYNRQLQYPFWDKDSKSRKEFDKEIIWKIPTFKEKPFLSELKNIYSYVYLPVETDIQSFTKIETEEMQKVFDKKLKNEIKKALSSIKLDSAWWLNSKLNEFVSDIETILNKEYCYSTWMKRNNNVTQTDIVDKILEVYFQKRYLSKVEWWVEKMVRELSAWEKRQALINLIYAFLSRWDERDKEVIIWIDEPENSLHTNICYEQFEKLKSVSEKAQTFITTHWYWFLPIIDKWTVHFLSNNNWEVTFDKSIDLYEYSFQTKKIPKDFSLKSTNDLIQSIFHSLKSNKPYNWIICEWLSDKSYLTYYLNDEITNNNLKIIAVWGIDLVKKFYKYLLLPIEENCEDITKGKVFCLTDSDADSETKDINQKNKKLEKSLVIKRLTKEDNHQTWLIKFETERKKIPIDIEQSLNPIIFKKTLDELWVEEDFLIKEENIQNIEGNTTIENLQNFKIIDYFSDEKIKNDFSQKYIEILKREDLQKNHTPQWINEVKSFFHNREVWDLDDLSTTDILNEKSEIIQNFDWTLFVKNLKDLWAKWWLTMSIRWSILSIRWDTLLIKPNSSIALSQINNSENRKIMLKYLSTIWVKKIQIL